MVSFSCPGLNPRQLRMNGFAPRDFGRFGNEAQSFATIFTINWCSRTTRTVPGSSKSICEVARLPVLVSGLQSANQLLAPCYGLCRRHCKVDVPMDISPGGICHPKVIASAFEVFSGSSHRQGFKLLFAPRLVLALKRYGHFRWVVANVRIVGCR
jgi:hypothetical protein